MIAPFRVLRRNRRAPMTSGKIVKYLSAAIALVLSSALSPSLLAQGPLPDAPMPIADGASAMILSPAGESHRHKFFDKENYALFAGVIALNSADFAVTRANLQTGGTEFNPLVRVFGRSTAGLVANFTGESVGTVVLSYMFHRTGHHKLERAVSFVNIGGSAAAVGFGLAHR